LVQTLLRRASRTTPTPTSPSFSKYGFVRPTASILPIRAYSYSQQDTAGQERFSSLSSAFFRGADAALFLFDVNRPETLHALERWWAEFRERAPVTDDLLDSYCAVFVGNKIDLVPDGEVPAVSPAAAQAFIDELLPFIKPGASPVLSYEEPARPLSIAVSAYEDALDGELSDPEADTAPYAAPPTDSIDIQRATRRSKSLTRSSLLFPGTSGTLTSIHTTRTSFYTPSSSVLDSSGWDLDNFASARSSPLGFRSTSPSPARGLAVGRRTSLTSLSSSSTSAATITPSLFTRAAPAAPSPHTSPADSPAPRAAPDAGPRLFFASAKSGVGVPGVFEYVARRVARRWEWEEAAEARTLHVVESARESVLRLHEEGRVSRGRPRGWKGQDVGACCAV
jgi:Ras-related protein Rab-7A